MSHRHDYQDWQRPEHGPSDHGRHDGRDFDWHHGRSEDRDFDWGHDRGEHRGFGQGDDRDHHHHHRDHHRGDCDRDSPDRLHEGDGPHDGQGGNAHGHNATESGSGSAVQHAGDELGWNDASWDDAGGFAAILAGHLPAGALAGGDHGPVIFFINDLDIDLFNIINQNTIIQNTLISFDAANGGSIDVGGDLNAIAGQQAFLTEGMSDLSHLG